MALADRTKTALDESRMLMLGAQILLGFQFQAPFQTAWASPPIAERFLHRRTSSARTSLNRPSTPSSDRREGCTVALRGGSGFAPDLLIQVQRRAVPSARKRIRDRPPAKLAHQLRDKTSMIAVGKMIGHHRARSANFLALSDATLRPDHPSASPQRHGALESRRWRHRLSLSRGQMHPICIRRQLT
jgi:hypothetical protein